MDLLLSGRGPAVEDQSLIGDRPAIGAEPLAHTRGALRRALHDEGVDLGLDLGRQGQLRLRLADPVEQAVGPPQGAAQRQGHDTKTGQHDEAGPSQRLPERYSGRP